MNRPGDLSRGCFEALHVAFAMKRARDQNTEVDCHRLIPALRMVIQETVVPWAQFTMCSQKHPHLIERRLPCFGYIFDAHRGPDRCQQLWLCYFHRNIVFHEYGSCGAAAHGNP